ncbi:MAG: hypothetical protein Q9208_003815 [Pyrenodesmia sp. 3 TL-2023]
MLKSTYKPAVGQPPLPAGWTEHKAPTGAGHLYYYNAALQQSTYTRPAPDPPRLSQHADEPDIYNGFIGFPPYSNSQANRAHHPASRIQHVHPSYSHQYASGDSRGPDHRQRPQPRDRPKSKHAIPGCEPWILVRTKLGRRFVYNPEQNESFWKFPPDVMKAVIEYDRLEREKKTLQEPKSVDSATKEKLSGVLHEQVPHEQATAVTGPLPLHEQDRQARREPSKDENDEYEEVEVTDDDDEETAAKRQKTADDNSEQPVEFNEDDIAYQLAAMGQDYGLDPGEYGDLQNQDLEEGAKGLPLSEEDAGALFMDMLDDYHINPYNPWEKLIEEARIIEDDRYTVLPNMKTRKEVWSDWSRDRIQKLKDQREKEAKKDPRIPFLAFLQSKATPKLYWPEFRRKYMKEPEMRNPKISDKEREKWYRDYINCLKLPESTLKANLVSMLKSVSLHALNRSTSMAALPPAILTDIRYISLRPSVRDPLIETHISTLPRAPQTFDDSLEEQEALGKQQKDRERREALAARQMQVQREKRRANEALEYSKGRMQEGEQEVQRAMRIGKEGLLGHMGEDEQPPLPTEGEPNGL